MGAGIVSRITGLRFQQHDNHRVNVYLDGEYAFGLQDIVAARLHLGQELSPAEITALCEKDSLEAMNERVLRLLAGRPRSEREVRSYLKRRGADDATVEQLLTRLREQHLVDDAEFARSWVENREEFRPRGARALRAELWQKGIDAEVADAAVQTVDEEQSALRAAARLAERLARTEEQEFRRRVFGLLQRRGFGYQVSQRVVARLWHELNDGTLADQT